MMKCAVTMLLVFLSYSISWATVATEIAAKQAATWYSVAGSSLGAYGSYNPSGVGGAGSLYDYCGGAFDTAGNRLIVWGGGHASYSGNEVYSFDLDDYAWHLLASYSSKAVIDAGWYCSEDSGDGFLSDGLPVQAHNSDLVAYHPTLNSLINPSNYAISSTGSVCTLDRAYTVGTGDHAACYLGDRGIMYVCTQAHTSSADNIPETGPNWTSYWDKKVWDYCYDGGVTTTEHYNFLEYSLSTYTWSHARAKLTTGVGFNPAYAGSGHGSVVVSKKAGGATGEDVWFFQGGGLIEVWKYTYDTDTWAKPTATGSGINGYGVHTGAVDTTNNIAVIIGDDDFVVWDLTTATRLTTTYTGSEGDAIVAVGAPGLAWDSATGLFIGWAGIAGSTTDVYALRVDTTNGVYHWTKVVPTSTDNAPASITLSDGGNGPYKRWAYSPTNNVFISAFDKGGYAALNETVKIYKLTETTNDIIPPVITAFTASWTSGLTIDVDSFTATDTESAIIGYQVTQTPVPPTTISTAWTGVPPTTYAVSQKGVYDLYAWAMDAFGNVSRYGIAEDVEVDCTIKTVCSSGCNYTKISDAVAWANAAGAGSIISISASDNPWQSWRADPGSGTTCRDKVSNFTDNIIGKITGDGITIRGVNGTAQVQWVCHDATSADNDWGVVGTTNGEMIELTNTVNNFRLENIRVTGAGYGGAGLRVYPTNTGSAPNGVLYIKNCTFDENSYNGLFTGTAVYNLDVVIVGSQFYNNARFYGNGGQIHNMYVGDAKSFTFFNSTSRASYVGQLVKSRASKNYIMYSRLTDEASGECSTQTYCSNQLLDLSYGGESYVIGNLFEKSIKAYSPSFISFNPEQRYTGYFTGGGVAELTDGATVTNSSTAHTWVVDTVYGSSDYGFTGTWAGNNKTGAMILRNDIGANSDFYTDITPAHGDIIIDAVFTYTGGDITITGSPVASAVGKNVQWSFGTTPTTNSLWVINNTFVNNFMAGSYGAYATMVYDDVTSVLFQNNLVVDLRGGETYPMLLDAYTGSGRYKTDTTDPNSVWRTSDPGFTSISTYDYSLATGISGVVNAGTHPGQTSSGFNLYPHYYYTGGTTPGKSDRTSVGTIDIGAYEYAGAGTTPTHQGITAMGVTIQ